jgi:glutathione-independent formaldehyde dehydrogenase
VGGLQLPAAEPGQPGADQAGGLGADRGYECVGYQAHDPQGREHPNAALNNLGRSVRFTGSIGVVGVSVPADPSGPGELARPGEVAFDYGLFCAGLAAMVTTQSDGARLVR